MGETKEILTITREFLSVPSVVCFEKPFLDFLEKKIKKLGYKTIKTKEYLVVKPKKNTAKYLFSSHIDRHGIIKTKNGHLEHAAYAIKRILNLPFKYEHYEHYLVAALRYSKDEFIAYNPKTGKKTKKYIVERPLTDYKSKRVYFSFTKPTKKQEKIFMIDPKLTVKGNLIWGQIDNVISAAVLYYFLKNTDFKHEIIFTTREEIGTSYKQVIEYQDTKEKPLPLLVLDTSPYEHIKDFERGFITIREGDEHGDFDFKMYTKLREYLRENNVPYNLKSSQTGRTELGRISHVSKGKYNGITIQIPTIHYHTAYECATLYSLKNYIKVIGEFSKK